MNYMLNGFLMDFRLLEESGAKKYPHPFKNYIDLVQYLQYQQLFPSTNDKFEI